MAVLEADGLVSNKPNKLLELLEARSSFFEGLLVPKRAPGATFLSFEFCRLKILGSRANLVWNMSRAGPVK